jgi:hypothetical protein
MKIVAHRGMWDKAIDQNTIPSFKRAVKYGCGIETDVRNLRGNLVISHGLVSESPLSFDTALGSIAPDLIVKKLPLCINIKEDGLVEMIKKSLLPYPALDYVIFDAAFPELYKFAKNKIPYLCRISDYEVFNKLIEDCSGIWLDSLDSDWITHNKLSEINSYKKRIFIVSPELHSREFEDFWEILRIFDFEVETFLCTDNILEALEKFKDNE